MEKRKPAYALTAFQQAALSPRGITVTTTAVRTALELGFDKSAMMQVVKTMRRSHFVKSMTSIANHTLWQDVYYVPSSAGTLYIKFTSGTITEFVLLSFKEKTHV